jgi:Domain of unknown function (DUF4499)
MNQPDRVERPHALVWIAILGGLTLLGVQAFSASFYAWWSTEVAPLPGQMILVWIFVACLPIHLGEAVYCFWLSNRLGMPRASLGWALQTFVIGFPSTWLLVKRSRATLSARSPMGEVGAAISPPLVPPSRGARGGEA